MSDGFELRQAGGISFVECPALTEMGFLNAFSTRSGGVSSMPAQSLHLSPKNDTAENYSENLRRFLNAIGAPEWKLRTAHQTHSAIRLLMESEETREGDALITQAPRSLVGVKTADCLPILIADPVTGAAAAVHAGWRGTLQRIVQRTIEDMQEELGSVAGDLVAALGPAACGRCYEVGADVAEPFKKEFVVTATFITAAPGNGKYFLDTAAANRFQLMECGLKSENIYEAPYCTMHQNDLFFSHRREQGPGRSLSVVGRKG